MVHQALKAAKKLSENGIEAEVIDPRTLVPLDKETIFESVKKTAKLVVVHEACKRGGFGAEISAMVTEELFDYLDAPVKRVAALNTPIPYNPGLEKLCVPDEESIVDSVRSIFR